MLKGGCKTKLELFDFEIYFAMTDAPLPTFVGYAIDYFDDNEIIDWATKFVPASDDFRDDPTLSRIVRLNRKLEQEIAKAGPLLREFVELQWPEFRLENSKSELYANRLFRRRLEQYLAEECSPWAVCRMIQPIEQLFDYPDWLGNMYHECDWITPDYEPVDCRHLENGARDTLAIPPVTMPGNKT